MLLFSLFTKALCFCYNIQSSVSSIKSLCCCNFDNAWCCNILHQVTSLSPSTFWGHLKGKSNVIIYNLLSGISLSVLSSEMPGPVLRKLQFKSRLAA